MGKSCWSRFTPGEASTQTKAPCNHQGALFFPTPEPTGRAGRAPRGKWAQVIRGALASVRISRDLRAIAIAHRSRKALHPNTTERN